MQPMDNGSGPGIFSRRIIVLVIGWRVRSREAVCWSRVWIWVGWGPRRVAFRGGGCLGGSFGAG